MRAAQMLYEGVDVAGQGTMGLITYMRTDSLRIADEAVAAAKDFITGSYGEQYVCPHKRTYKSRSATAAQDAHEAVRPTNPALTPDEVGKSVTGDAAKLYRPDLEPLYCQPDERLPAGYRFRGHCGGGLSVPCFGICGTFDGFTALYEEATDEKREKRDCSAASD